MEIKEAILDIELSMVKDFLASFDLRYESDIDKTLYIEEDGKIIASISKAKDLIQACAESGADFVKFQWVYADEILHPNTGFVSLPGGNIRLYDRFKQLELTIDFYAEVKDYAKSCGCGFICSPFGLRSLKELISINPDAITM